MRLKVLPGKANDSLGFSELPFCHMQMHATVLGFDMLWVNSRDQSRAEKLQRILNSSFIYPFVSVSYLFAFRLQSFCYPILFLSFLGFQLRLLTDSENPKLSPWLDSIDRLLRCIDSTIGINNLPSEKEKILQHKQNTCFSQSSNS